MISPESRQKSRSAEMAHMNDLLDEALIETFPASDPIAINVELESSGHGMAITLRACRAPPPQAVAGESTNASSGGAALLWRQAVPLSCTINENSKERSAEKSICWPNGGRCRD